MIHLSNGHSFEFMTASGALAYDGRGWPWEWPLRWLGLIDPNLFTIVTKTITRHPRKGNLRWYAPLRVVKHLPAGAVNAIGLTNPGIDWWCREVLPRLTHRSIVLSLEAENETDLVQMIEKVQSRKNSLVAYELNISCPNTFDAGKWNTEKAIQIVLAAEKRSNLPLILKMGVTHDAKKLCQELKGVVQAIAINSIPWSVIFPEKPSPLARFGGGGVSGKIAQEWTWKLTRELVEIGTIPVIGPSVWEYEDIAKLFQIGAKAVSFGSIFLWHPWRPTAFVRRWRESPSSPSTP